MLTESRPPGPHAHIRYASPVPFVRDRLRVLRDLAIRYGDCCRFRLGFREVYFLNHPEHIRRLLAVEQSKVRRSAVTQLTRFVLGNSVFNADGEAHRQQRKRLLPMLHAGRLNAYGHLMAQTAHQHQRRWRDGDRVNASRVARHLALEIGSRALFGIDLSPEADAIDQSLRVLFRTMNRVDHPLQWVGWVLPLPDNFRVLRAVWRLRNIAARTAKSARLNPLSDGTLLRALLDAHARGEIGERLVRDEVSLLMAAGHETTAQALTWALYLIGRHPDVQDRLCTEIERVVGAHLPEWETMHQARYMESVVKEALRLFPPFPIFDRYTCAPLEFGEHHIPAGRTVFVSPFVTQRDSRFFAEPERFDPDRWQTVTEDAHSAYFPFGVGPRRCLGEAFATAEMMLVLAVLLQRWEFRFEGEASIESEALITLRPKQEVWLRVARRALGAARGHAPIRVA